MTKKEQGETKPERKTWLVRKVSYLSTKDLIDLEYALNQLAADGYQIKDIVFEDDSHSAIVIAFDPLKIMAAQQELLMTSMQSQLGGGLGAVQFPDFGGIAKKPGT